MRKILIVIPYGNKDEKKVEQLTKVIGARAGMSCQIEALKDEEGIGWVAMHNKRSKEDDYDIYVYTAADYYPGRNFLRKAYNKMVSSGKGLIGFNDGKWDGNNATAGMIKKELLKDNYSGGTIFYEGYKKHGADPDLTELCMKKDAYAYEPTAILMEIHPEKELTTYEYNKEDQELFRKRRARGFTK